MTEFEEVYDLYFRDVYLFVLSLTHDPHVAEDITSETFMKAMTALSGFRGDSDIRVWLCQIAKHAWFNWLRKNGRSAPVENVPEPETRVKPDPLKMLIQEEESIRIHAIIHELKEPYREVFFLRTFAELSFKDIAQLFGKSDNWACVTHHRARQKIIQKLEEEVH